MFISRATQQQTQTCQQYLYVVQIQQKTIDIQIYIHICVYKKTNGNDLSHSG
jgi:hypothetical protein